jgi:hypothetical protein
MTPTSVLGAATAKGLGAAYCPVSAAKARQLLVRAAAYYRTSLKILAWIEMHFGWVKGSVGLGQVK